MIRVRAFGPLSIALGDSPVHALHQQPLRCAVFLYIAAQPETTREAVIRLFWPDREPARARALLSQTLYELKRTLGGEWLAATGERLSAPAVQMDMRAFERAMAAGDFESAIALYHGPFLADFSGLDAREFEAWVEQTRAQLGRLHRRARRELIDQRLQQNELDQALALAQGWVSIDPLEDEAQHRVIEILGTLGRRAEALQAYEQYRERLARELELEPLDETRQLAERIRSIHTIGMSSAADAPAAPPRAELPSTVAAPPVEEGARKGRRTYAMAGLAAALALIAFLVSNQLRDPPAQGTLPIDSQGHDLSRIAVLYFDDHSPKGELAYLAKGLTEALIDQLSQVEALSVISRNGVKPYAERSVPIDSIGRALAVGTIVEASVQESGGLVRVSVRLVDAASGQRLENTQIERPLGELFALQDAIARDVAGFLRRRLGREFALREAASPTRNAEAWQRYQQADALREEVLQANPLLLPNLAGDRGWLLEKADSLAQIANALDPRWAAPLLLRGWIAHDRAMLARGTGLAAVRPFTDAGERYAAQALRALPNDAAALELRGTIRYKRAREEGKLPLDPAVAAAERDLREAVIKDPRRARAWHVLGRLRLYAGAAEEAAAHAKRALEADAFLREAPDVYNLLYRVALQREQYTEARDLCASAHREFPRNYLFLECHLMVAVYQPWPLMRMDSADKIMEKLRALEAPTPRTPIEYKHIYRQTLLAALWARNGRPDSTRVILSRAEELSRTRPGLSAPFGADAAVASLLAGDTATAIDWLRIFMRGSPQYADWVRTNPLLARLSSSVE